MAHIEKEIGRGQRAYAISWAAVIIAVMAVVFSLAIGPRMRGTEREQYKLRNDITGLRQEMTALRRDLARARAEQQAEPQTVVREQPTRTEVEVTNSKGETVPLPNLEESNARQAVLEEHYRRLDERLDRLVKDLKSSNVDLGISDSNGGE